MWKNLDADVCLTTRMCVKRCLIWISLVANEMNYGDTFHRKCGKNWSHASLSFLILTQIRWQAHDLIKSEKRY